MSIVNSFFRRYTPPTCALEIKGRESSLSQWVDFKVLNHLKFKLVFDDPRQPQERRVTIWGERADLEDLCQAVETYVQQFIDQSRDRLPTIFSTSPVGNSIPSVELENGNGFGNGLSSFSEPQLDPYEPDPANPLLPQIEGENGSGEDLPPFTTLLPALNLKPASPYLQPRGLLAHDLFLGPLETPESGPVVSLTVLQLFDLASALEEYAVDFPVLPAIEPSIKLQKLPVWTYTAVAVLLVAVGSTPILWKLLNPPNETTLTTSSTVRPEQNPTELSATALPETQLPLAVPTPLAASTPLAAPSPNAAPMGPPLPTSGAPSGLGGPGSLPPGLGGPGSLPPGLGSPGSLPPGLGSPGSLPPGLGSPGSLPPGLGSPGSLPPGLGNSASLPPGLGGPGSPTPQLSSALPPGISSSPQFQVNPSPPLTAAPRRTVSPPRTPTNTRVAQRNTPAARPQPAPRRTTNPPRAITPPPEPEFIPFETNPAPVFDLPPIAVAPTEPQWSTAQDFNTPPSPSSPQLPTLPQTPTTPPSTVDGFQPFSSPPQTVTSVPPSFDTSGGAASNDNNAVANNRLFDTIPQVAEARSKLQQNWKPPTDLSQSLQYNIKLSGDGSIERIIPLTEAARKFMDRTGIPLVGEPFVSPINGGGNPQMRVVFTPDGKVETFVEQ